MFKKCVLTGTLKTTLGEKGSDPPLFSRPSSATCMLHLVVKTAALTEVVNSFPPSLLPPHHPSFLCLFLPPALSLPAENRVPASLRCPVCSLCGVTRLAAHLLNTFAPFQLPLQHCPNQARRSTCGNLSWKITTGCWSTCGKNAACFLREERDPQGGRAIRRARCAWRPRRGPEPEGPAGICPPCP